MAKTLRALFLGVALVAFMIACGGYALYSEIRQPAGTSDTIVEFEVEPGESTTSIATRLRTEGLIRQPLLFTYLVRSQGFDGKLQAGRYFLRSNMTMGEIISVLQRATPIEEIQVRIGEGARLEEIAQQLVSGGLKNMTEQEFLQIASNGAMFKSKHFLLSSLPEGASLEGYLFPDTYRFMATATITDVIETMLDNFDQQYATFEKSIQVDRSVHDIVTIASIVQREAAREDEMPKIAAVFWNRLKPEFLAETGNGKLQADPTVQYALGSPSNWWPKLDAMTVEQINAVNSPYNTRVNPGLPPGPISSPGLAALRAAARPDNTEPYLYFVASCDEPGAHQFATSLAEFQRFEQEYLNCKRP